MATLADYSGNATPTVAEWNSYILNGGLQFLSEYTVEYDLLATPPTPLVTTIEMKHCFAYPARDYRNFRVVLGKIFNTAASPSASTLLVQMHDGTSPIGTAIYDTHYRSIDTAGTPTFAGSTGQLAFFIGPTGTSQTLQQNFVFDICTPQSGFPTIIYGRGGQLGARQVIFSGRASSASYDGLSISIFGGTIAGSCQVYGYRTEL